jgi:hypothetical protein
MRRPSRVAAATLCAGAVIGGGTVAAIAAIGGDDNGPTQAQRDRASQGPVRTQGWPSQLRALPPAPSGPLNEAAEYLGVDLETLMRELQDGHTLAEIARDRGKGVDGLVDAMVQPIAERLDEAVEDGRISRAQRDRLVDRVRRSVRRLVEGDPGGRPEGDSGLPLAAA